MCTDVDQESSEIAAVASNFPVARDPAKSGIF